MPCKRRFAQQDEVGHFGSYEVTGPNRPLPTASRFGAGGSKGVVPCNQGLLTGLIESSTCTMASSRSLITDTE